MSDLAQMDVKDLLRYKNIIVALVIIVICGFFVNSLYMDHHSRMSNLESDSRLLDKAESQIKEWEEINRNYQDLIGSFLSGDRDAFRSFVESRARDSQIRIQSLSGSRQEASFYEIGTIEMSVSSLHRNLVKFLSELEEKNIFVYEFRLTSEDQREVKADIVLKTISIKP